MGRKIVVMRRIPEPALAALREAGHDVWVSPHDRPLSTAELHEAAAGADAILTLLHDRVDGALLDAAGPQLQVVANVAVGYDNVDVAACTERGVRFTNTPGVLTEATADLAFALILMATRRLGEGERVIRRREAWSWSMFYLLGTSLQGKVLGVVGLGQIGAATARRAKAFGMDVLYSSRSEGDPAVVAELGTRRVDFDELLETSHVVSLHCPLLPETHHLIDAGRLAQMRSDAYLVNTTRGPVVDEAALAAALRDGVIAGAGLDVFEREPVVMPALLTMENVVLLPHLGSATRETRAAMGMRALENLRLFFSGKPLRDRVV